MTGRDRQRGAWSWIYDGRQLAFAVELHHDGWHVFDHPKRDLIGVFATREMAIAFANARRANTPAAAIAGEHIADARRVNRIRAHQRHAKAQRARRAPKAET